MPTIRDIASGLGREDRLQLFGASADTPIDRAAPLDAATAGAVSFCGHTLRDPGAALAGAAPSLLIADESLALDENALRRSGVQALIRSPNARLDFVRVVTRFFAPARPSGIHPSAVVSPSARIAASACVGPLCSIGDQVEIGDDAVIHSGVHIYHHVRVGRRVTVHSGTVIGADGFGYEKNERGELEKFPQLGAVVIEDDVEIGANTCIDRGALGDTRIGRGARIDNLVHIAHNVQVGAHAAVIADVMIGGSAKIGAHAWIAPSACIRDRVSVGERAVVGLASLVTKDVPADVTVLGAPARPYDKGAARGKAGADAGRPRRRRAAKTRA